jgi:phosphate transport system substrate-binding protein
MSANVSVRMFHVSALLTSLVMTSALLHGCGAPVQVNQAPTPIAQDVANPAIPVGDGIQVDGSSTVFPITEIVAKAYQQTKATKSTPIDVKFSGTGGGFKKFCAGETDVNNASRPITKLEIEACGKTGVRFLELPIGFDALTLVVNSQNSWAKDLTVDELKKIWSPEAQGKITNWQQVRAGFPDRPLKLFGPGQASGTFDYFTEVTTGQSKASRTDYTASEDDEVLVSGVEKEVNALGYFGFAYYEKHQNRLRAVAIDSGKGPVLPARETVEKSTYQPYARPLFIYVNMTAAQKKPELRAFVEFYLKNAQDLVTTVGYIPLPSEAYKLAHTHFYTGKVGTVFDGEPQPNLTINELMRKQATF